MAYMAAPSSARPYDPGEQSDSSTLSNVSSSYLSDRNSTTPGKRKTPNLSRFVQKLKKTGVGGLASGKVDLGSGRRSKQAESDGKVEQSKLEGCGLRKSSRNDQTKGEQMNRQSVKSKEVSKANSQVRNRNSITKSKPTVKSRKLSTSSAKTNKKDLGLARVQRGNIAPSPDFVRSATKSLSPPTPLPLPSSARTSSSTSKSSGTRKRKLSTSKQRAPSPPLRPSKQPRKSPLPPASNNKQLRSKGSAEDNELVWGRGGMGALIGKPPEVQQRAREKDAKMRRKRTQAREKLKDAERRINGDSKARKVRKGIDGSRQDVKKAGRTVEVISDDVEKRHGNEETKQMEARLSDPSHCAIVQGEEERSLEEVAGVGQSKKRSRDEGTKFCEAVEKEMVQSQDLAKMETSGTPESEQRELTADVAFTGEEGGAKATVKDQEHQAVDTTVTTSTSSMEALDPLTVTPSSHSARSPRRVITVTTKRISIPTSRYRDEQNTQVEKRNAGKMARAIAKEEERGKALQQGSVESERIVETPIPSSNSLPTSLELEDTSNSSQQPYSPAPAFKIPNSHHLDLAHPALPPPPAPAPPRPITFAPSQSVSEVPGYAAMQAASALSSLLDHSALPQLPSSKPLPAASEPKKIKVTVPKTPFISKPTPPKELEPALLSQEGWVLPERDLKIRENGRPPVWAVGRQELCETLDYFKSYQGGHYDRKERCLGYLLDGFPSANDRCDQHGKVIISHGGGNSHSTTAGFVLHSSQERNNMRMRALQNCLERKVPVMLLAGNQYSFFPKLRGMGFVEGGNEVRYAVLGAYLISDIWAEGEPVEGSKDASSSKDEYFVRFKVRFEWVESQGTPWFSDIIGKEPSSREESASTVPHSSSGSSQAATHVTCRTCKKSHRAVYLESVECYNESCINFFRLPDGRMVPPANLTYHPSLLASTFISSSNSLIPQPVIPQTLQTLATSPRTRDYSKASWRGFGCSDCGRVSSRSEWLRLSCQECGAEVDATGDKLTVDQIRLQVPTKTNSRSRKDSMGPVLCADGIKQSPINVQGFQGYTFDLGQGSKVHQMWPSTSEGHAEADRLLAAYQGEAAGNLFKRNPLNCHRSQGSLLCQQFTWNGGEEYLHAIAAQTYPFDSTETSLLDQSRSDSSKATDEPVQFAAPCAKDACDYLKMVAPLVVSKDKVHETQFNEILSVAYMAGGKMNYHDDGEIGLGSVVSSISLGSDAIMSFRPKEKRDSKKKQENPVESKSKSRATKAVLRLLLRHGHVMLMEGTEMQKVFEHAVEPQGLRFAATARLVGPEHARKGKKHPAGGQPKIEKPKPTTLKVRKQKASSTQAPSHRPQSPTLSAPEIPLVQQVVDVPPRSPKYADRFNNITSFDLPETTTTLNHLIPPYSTTNYDTPASSTMSRPPSCSSTSTVEPVPDSLDDACSLSSQDVASKPPKQDGLLGKHFKKTDSSSTNHFRKLSVRDFYSTTNTPPSLQYPTHQYPQAYPPPPVFIPTPVSR
ncbi:hypothetical protein JCM5353_004142 [Sporobolomyces roseus]